MSEELKRHEQDPNLQDPKEEKRASLFWSTIAGQVALWYAILFFYGWIYMASFYEEFDIDISVLDTPAYAFPLHAMFAFQSIFLLCSYLIGPIGLVYLIPPVIRDSKLQTRWIVFMKQSLEQFQHDVEKFCQTSLSRFIAFWFVMLVFLITLILANREGVRAAQRQWNDSPHAHLAFKSADRQQYEPALVKANDESRLLLLTQTKDLVVVFERQKSAKPPGHVFVVARADVASVFVWP
jgi:hypothetical protein